MSTDYRALCAELADALHGHTSLYEGHECELVTRARTALAQPEPEVDEGIDDLVAWLWSMRDLAGECNPDEQRRYELAATLLGQEAAETTHWRPANARPAIEPVAVSERLPEPGKKVIAYYLNALGNSRTILAEWVPAKTKADDGLTDDDFAEYDEEPDEYYWPEGWYEVIENWDDYGAVFVNEGEITHWRPLPPGPHHALPVPGAEVQS